MLMRLCFCSLYARISVENLYGCMLLYQLVILIHIILLFLHVLHKKAVFIAYILKNTSFVDVL